MLSTSHHYGPAFMYLAFALGFASIPFLRVSLRRRGRAFRLIGGALLLSAVVVAIWGLAVMAYGF